ncbi:MAG: hypothetical protein IJO29_01595 [Oscillospiraceae bacterium]|nr:hypothetical protein [Oscillospiraceae bacterium]
MAEAMKKLKRSAHLLYINATPNAETPSWFLIGQDVEDLSIELNPDTETKKNILDQVSIQDNGYEPSFDVDTYYANPSDGAFYEWIKNITMNRLVGDDCKTQVLEVLIDKTEGPFDAWIEDAIAKPQSYGGPQGGISIPYNVGFCGNRDKGTATITDKVPSFSKATSTAATE